ncbi:10372_t:CDS:1, partial [Scutellospora calospora]
YSIAYPPHLELCDHCGLLLTNNNATVFVCDHGYYLVCYSRRYIHCEIFYKKGIFKNIEKFVKRIKEGANILTKEDIDEEEEEDAESIEETIENVREIQDISSKLEEANNQIENW